MQDSSLSRSHQESDDSIPTEEEIALRKRWLKFTDADEAVLTSDVDALLGNNVDQLLDEMYEHFLEFDETKKFFPNDAVLSRARAAQDQYFRQLTKGTYDRQYVMNRLRVGSTHHGIDLDPKWYIGAYNAALSWLIPFAIKRHGSDSTRLQKVISALLKVIFFDMGFAIDSYIAAKEVAIKNHRDALRELETERRVTKGILESAPIGIVSIDRAFVCLECNDEFVRIVGRRIREDVIGHNLFTLASQLKRAALEDVLLSEQPCRKTADPLCLSDSLGINETYWDWAAWPVKEDSGAVTGMVAMFANSTDRVLLQQQREDFVATLTHDLKTPVSATNRAVRFLLDGDFGPVSNAQTEILETILQSNTALYSLVQTLLDVYRFDSGVKELSIREYDLGQIVTQLVHEIMPLAQEKNIKLILDLPEKEEVVACDDAEIRRILQNLIDNSLKFTPPGGSITITLKRLDGKTRVSVQDTGKGIPEENKPKLFQRFWQAGSTGRYYASTGLGLYLCRRIIEAHGGKIWCESILGKGSNFSFEF